MGRRTCGGAPAQPEREQRGKQQKAPPMSRRQRWSARGHARLPAVQSPAGSSAAPQVLMKLGRE